MRRSARVEPTTLPPSITCSSNGTLNATHPADDPADANDAVTDAVDPAATVTVRATIEASPNTDTACVPGVTFDNVPGVTPRDTPPTVTRAPGGSEVISSRLLAGGTAAGAMSTYCDSTTPA